MHSERGEATETFASWNVPSDLVAICLDAMSAYDLHQRLRTKAIRQLKKKSYDDAIKTIADGSIQMLQQKEQGSGCDLAVYLVDVYEQSGKPCDKQTREPLVQIISLAQNDFWRKKVIDAAVKWSVKASRNPAGDGYLRLAIAETLVKGEQREGGWK